MCSSAPLGVEEVCALFQGGCPAVSISRRMTGCSSIEVTRHAATAGAAYGTNGSIVRVTQFSYSRLSFHLPSTVWHHFRKKKSPTSEGLLTGSSRGCEESPKYKAWAEVSAPAEPGAEDEALPMSSAAEASSGHRGQSRCWRATRRKIPSRSVAS
jgi:hypothetical protein